MLSKEFLITALIVVLAPGTGVIYTVSNGILKGRRASVAAAAGCTLGIVPHLLACTLGLSLLLHASAVAFYLLFLAWQMWRETGTLKLDSAGTHGSTFAIAKRGFLINILNPKLSLFFLAFLPTFLPPGAPHPTLQIGMMSAVFMAMTLLVFLGYGLAASCVRTWFSRSEKMVSALRRSFALCFAFLGLRLVTSER
jgi:threonine/homoserine/homoserine lactone efflux protein